MRLLFSIRPARRATNSSSVLPKLGVDHRFTGIRYVDVVCYFSRNNASDGIRSAWWGGLGITTMKYYKNLAGSDEGAGSASTQSERVFVNVVDI